MNESKFFLSCNCKTKCAFYPFLLPILFLFIRYFHDIMIEESKTSGSFKILKYNLPYLFYLFLPKIFSFILIPIIKFKIRGENTNPEQNILIKNYHIFAENQNRKKLFLLFYIISLLVVIQDSGDFLLYYFQKSDKNIGWFIEKKTGFIIFVPLFSYFLLDKVLYRHHILALILGSIGAFIVNYCRFPLNFSHIEDYPFHLLNILFSSMYSFALVLIKYIMAKYLILSPYVFLFYDGIFCIINSFIVILLEWPILVNIPDKNDKLKGENDNYLKNNYLEIFTIFIEQSKNFYIYFFLSFILQYFYYIINVLTLYNFSPFFIVVLEACLPLDNDFISILFGKENNNKEFVFKRTYYQLIGYVIIFIAALILNEILLLNFCGFNKNTYKRISIRANKDVETELKIDENEKEEFNEDENEDEDEEERKIENNIN